CAAGDERSRLGLNELQYRELREGELPELVFLLLEVGSEVRAQEPVWSELAGDGFNAFGARRLLPLPLMVLEGALDRGLDAVRLCLTPVKQILPLQRQAQIVVDIHVRQGNSVPGRIVIVCECWRTAKHSVQIRTGPFDLLERILDIVHLTVT